MRGSSAELRGIPFSRDTDDSGESGGHRSRETICDRLNLHAARMPTALAYCFLSDRGRIRIPISYSELRERVQSRAAAIVELTEIEEPVGCVFDPGLDFVITFLACLWSGRIAVPLAPPRPNESCALLAAILAHSGCRTILSLSGLSGSIRRHADAPQQTWVDVDELAGAGAITEPIARQSQLALLQYTSGSSGSPKGVMIGHDNLLASSRQIGRSFEHDAGSVGLTWLPPQHDMGLVGGIVHPLDLGFPSYLMSPVEIIRHPATWLQLISDLGVTTSGGPNFAFELCLQRVTPERRAELDLSRWSVAFCGAEPISENMLKRFAKAFAECGFRSSAFLTCYGLAEATLQVTGIAKSDPPTAARPVEAPDSGPSYVSCGTPVADQDLIIWEERSGGPAPEGTVGEIWVRGPNVARGYWSDPALTDQVFRAKARGVDGHWLRTGDMGFMAGGGLHICGRRTAQIVVRGRNHSLEDIERTANAADPSLAGYVCAAYGVAEDGEDRLVVVQEAPRPSRAPEARHGIEALIRKNVVRLHGVNPLAVRLVPLGTVPRTRSGKIQRHRCTERHPLWT